MTELSIATETIQPTKPKLLSGPLQNKFAEPCSSNVDQLLKQTTGYLKENGDAITRIRTHKWGKQKQISLVTTEEESQKKIYRNRAQSQRYLGGVPKKASKWTGAWQSSLWVKEDPYWNVIIPGPVLLFTNRPSAQSPCRYLHLYPLLPLQPHLRPAPQGSPMFLAVLFWRSTLSLDQVLLR